MLKKVLDEIENSCNYRPTRLTITIPAYFHHTQRVAVRWAAKKAGLERVDLINEPTAAALCYLFELREVLQSEAVTFLIFDIGGGTTDVTVAEMLLNQMGLKEIRVLSTSGNSHFGGANVSVAIAAAIEEELKPQLEENVLESLRSTILEKAEEAKKKLSEKNPAYP